MKYISKSAEETKEIAKKLAEQVKNKSVVIGISGELGAGKTTFTQGFAEGLGITEKINSPTFTIIKQHNIPNSSKNLYHIDLYRLENPNIKELGIEEIVSDNNSILLIEWPEKTEIGLTNKININKLSEDLREISID